MALRALSRLCGTALARTLPPEQVSAWPGRAGALPTSALLLLLSLAQLLCHRRSFEVQHSKGKLLSLPCLFGSKNSREKAVSESPQELLWFCLFSPVERAAWLLLKF